MPGLAAAAAKVDAAAAAALGVKLGLRTAAPGAPRERALSRPDAAEKGKKGVSFLSPYFRIELPILINFL